MDQSGSMIRNRLALVLVVISLSGCARTRLAPAVEPIGVAVEVARASFGGAGVVHVSREAVVDIDADAGSAVIYVLRGERAERRSVAIADVTDESVEVVSGLVAGEEVITNRQSTLHDGDLVRAASRSETPAE